MGIQASIFKGSSGGDTVTVEPIGAAKNAQVGDKVLLNTSLSSGAYFNPDRTPGATLTFCAWADLTDKKAYWIINANSSSSGNKDGVRYDISDPNHVEYEGTFNLPTAPQTTNNGITMGSDYLGCFGYTDNSNLYLMIKNSDGIIDGTLSQSFVCPTYWSISRNSNILCYYDRSASHVVRLTKNSTGTFDVTELTFTTTPAKPDVGTVSPDGTLIYYRRQIFKVNETTVDLINANSVGPNTSYSVDIGAFTDDNKYLFAIQRGNIYTMELGSNGSLPSVVSSTSSIGNTFACHMYLCKNGYIQTSQGLLAYNQETGVVTRILASGSGSNRSSFTPLTDDWSVGVDAPTGGLFAVNGTNGPTQLPFSPMDTQVVNLSCMNGNVVFSSGVGSVNCETTGISKTTGSSMANIYSGMFVEKDGYTISAAMTGTSSYYSYFCFPDGTVKSVFDSTNIPFCRCIGSQLYGQGVKVWKVDPVTKTLSSLSHGSYSNSVIIGNTVYANIYNYKWVLNWENNTVTEQAWTNSLPRVTAENNYISIVSPGEKYVFFVTESRVVSSLYSFDSSTETFTQVEMPTVLSDKIAAHTKSHVSFTPDGKLYLCGDSTIYTFSWDEDNINSLQLLDTFSCPIPVSMTALGVNDNFYLFDRALFSKGTSTEQVAEIYNGHNFNNTTLTGFVESVNLDGTVDVATVLPPESNLTVSTLNDLTVNITRIR